MRVLHLLRFSISLLFTIFSFTYFGYFLICIFSLVVNREIPSFINLNLHDSQILNLAEIDHFGLMLIYFFIYFSLMFIALGSLYFLRKFVYDIKPRKVFTAQQTKYLKRIGQLIITSSLGKFLFSIFLIVFSQNEKYFIHNGTFNLPDLFDSEYFIIGIGLFFLFLAKLFSVAQQQKEENELTI